MNEKKSSARSLRETTAAGKVDPHHYEFVKRLAPEERMLITLRDELYGGSWDVMMEDLEKRLRQGPHIPGIGKRIRADMRRIENLQSYETRHKVDLKVSLQKVLGE